MRTDTDRRVHVRIVNLPGRSKHARRVGGRRGDLRELPNIHHNDRAALNYVLGLGSLVAAFGLAPPASRSTSHGVSRTFRIACPRRETCNFSRTL